MAEVHPLHVRSGLRVHWVDHAKGICIFFVVMLHVNDLAFEQLGTSGWLAHVVDFARPFRMPDFFLIAGLFLAASLRRPWRSYLDTKVVHFAYFYVLWMTLQFAIFDARHLAGEQLVIEYARRFVDPEGSLWFIHILPVFFVVTRATRAVPWWVMLAASAALHSLRVDTGWHVPDQFAARYVFFYSGFVAAPHIFRLAGWFGERPHVAAAYLCAWAILNELAVASGIASTASLALGYVGALAVIVAAVSLSRCEWAAPLRYLGASSIVVYLGEALVSTLVARLVFALDGDAGSLALVATILTIFGTLVLRAVLASTPAGFLYARPAWLTAEPRSGRPS
jgi:uncharacterized membrane protein YcfT